ncbi:MAG TPA: type II and III secretion system protein family protein [Pyrinomonadaceae bacterium]|nr:type II and III secretion system protein family protein [Pyrinomonadaceae bacterium]
MKPCSAVRNVILTLTVFLFIFPLHAAAQEMSTNASFGTDSKEPIPVNVLVGQSRLLTFDRPIERFSVSNPEIAEAVLVTSNQVVVNGKGFGQINFIAWEKGSSRFVVFDVYVRTNLSLIDSQIRALFPKDDIRLSQANGSVVLSGNVSDPRIATHAEAVVQAAGFKTVNLLESPVKSATQVQLQVRVAEVSRNKMRELGTSWAYQASPGTGGYINSGTGPSSLGDVAGGLLSGNIANSLNLFVMGGNTLSFIRALQQTGALRALAEPNLIAMNGQEASFLAGGEYPVPVVQASGDRSNVTIIFKEYGVRLNFKPTIIDEDHIRLELEPEVSTLDFANGVKFEGFSIPALRTRRARTGIELRDGQSFALAGLLDNNETQTLSRVPGIGDIPILGNLFRSKQFQKNESELMFIVTAQLVKPVNRDDLPSLPNVDNMKNGSLLGVEPPKGGASLIGPSGFTTTPGTSTTPAVVPAKTAAPATSGAKVETLGSAAPPAAVNSPKGTPNQ